MIILLIFMGVLSFETLYADCSKTSELPWSGHGEQQIEAKVEITKDCFDIKSETKFEPHSFWPRYVLSVMRGDPAPNLAEYCRFPVTLTLGKSLSPEAKPRLIHEELFCFTEDGLISAGAMRFSPLKKTPPKSGTVRMTILIGLDDFSKEEVYFFPN